MSDARIEAVASLHLLVWIAKADRALHASERAMIQDALREVGLDDLVSARELFDDEFEIADQVALLRTKVAREEAFRAAYQLAFVDGECSVEERRRLNELRSVLAIDGAREHELAEAADRGRQAPESAAARFRGAIRGLLDAFKSGGG
ncbi:MAG: TerB family tellurite resistance protein [Polyangiaceae bacterium]|nr:TerB family tellurite resistance protein [Polyangiaceae bacterium]